MKIYFIYVWHPNPAGGALATCRAVKALNNCGYDAILMYKCGHSDPMPLIECSNEIPLMAWNPEIITDNDILVVCEVDGIHITGFRKSIRKIVLNQSPYMMFALHGLSPETLNRLCNKNNNVTDMIVVSQHALEIISPHLSEVKTHRLHHYPEFTCGQNKKFQIAYFPFKSPHIKQAILACFPDIPAIPIDYRPHKEVEKIMQESMFFLDWSELYYEGFGLSSFEAMACGCVLIGNMWPAAKEFMNLEFGCLVDSLNDWKPLIPMFQQMIDNYNNNPDSVVEMGVKASEFIHDHYSEKQFEEDLDMIFK